jgi:exodeoxyribonuclease V alpha subunit
VGLRQAAILIDGWTYYGCAKLLLLWMQQVNLDVRIGRKLLNVYGGAALQRLREDPYRLLAFGMTWQKTDELASVAFGVLPDDPRRLAVAVETEQYDAFDNGHTYALISDIERAVERRIGPSYGAAAVAMSLQMGVALCSGDRICRFVRANAHPGE